jgi:hypothetical protein
LGARLISASRGRGRRADLLSEMMPGDIVGVFVALSPAPAVSGTMNAVAIMLGALSGRSARHSAPIAASSG